VSFHVDDLIQFVRPLTERLPQAWQDYLANGGWPVALGVAGVILLLLLLGIADLIWIRLFRRRPAPTFATGPEEDLANLPPPLLAPADKQFQIYHVPARLRLIVAAPSGADRALDEKQVKRELERLWPGVRDVLTADKPRFRLWPAQLSPQGFAMAFHRHLRRPDPEVKTSPWISVAGKVQFEGQTLMLGLVLWTSEKTTLGQLTLEPHQWRDILRLGAN
jgi:hypothetical protein